jgi:hypothetical protein
MKSILSVTTKVCTVLKNWRQSAPIQAVVKNKLQKASFHPNIPKMGI